MALKFERFPTEDTLFIRHFDADTSNSLTLEDLNGLEEFLNDPSIRFIVWTSEHQRVFCSGGNLSFYSKKSKKESLETNSQIKAILDRLFETPAVTVAAVNGDCYGGGVELLSCFDHVICESHCFFALWQRKIALSFGWGGGRRLLQRMSPSQLKNLALDTLPISAKTALDYGIVNEVCKSRGALESAIKFVRSQSRLSTHPVPYIKKLNAKNEWESIESLWHNDDHKNVLEKFKNRN